MLNSGIKLSILPCSGSPAIWEQMFFQMPDGRPGNSVNKSSIPASVTNPPISVTPLNTALYSRAD